MPKERFHIYLADRVLKACAPPPPILFDMPAFFLGAVSPDIFYYDLPFFSLAPLGDRVHSLIERRGISIVYDWIAKKPFEKEAICWGLGFACHFLVDSAWHPLIDEFSRAALGPGLKLSPLERHRMIESEIEAFWLPTQKKYSVRADLWGKRARLPQIASHYSSFLTFAGGPAPPQNRISRCFLLQNLLLRLFANRGLGQKRDLLLSFPPTRSLGALVAPLRPVLPDLLARATPEHRNPFSDSFMNHAFASLAAEFCGPFGRVVGDLMNSV